jgi:hypothetical protein
LICESGANAITLVDKAWLSDVYIKGGDVAQVTLLGNPLLADLELNSCPQLRGVELAAPRLKSLEIWECWRLRKLNGTLACPTLINLALFSTSLRSGDIVKRCPTIVDIKVCPTNAPHCTRR